MAQFIIQLFALAIFACSVSGGVSSNKSKKHESLIHPEAQITKLTEGCGDAFQYSKYMIHYSPGQGIPGSPIEILVCYDHDMYTTLWTRHTIFSECVPPGEEKSWQFHPRTDLFGDIGIANRYTKYRQRKTVMGLVKSHINRYIPASPKEDEKEFFLAKGHLTPDADYVNHMNRGATYYYINAVPQWQIIKNGNWKGLEKAVRLMLPEEGEIEVYTGSAGILELPGCHDHLKEIGLEFVRDEHHEPIIRIPVPKLLWKCFMEPASGQHYLVVMHNNPWLESTNILPPAATCKNICKTNDKPRWVKWDPEEISKGFTHCCEVTNCFEVPYHIPDFKGW